MQLWRLDSILAANPNVLNPYFQMQHQLSASAKAVSGYFEEIDSALDKGASVKNAVRNPSGGGLQDDRLEGIFRRIITQSRLAGFSHGAQLSKKAMPALYGRDVAARADLRAGKVNAWIKGTTKKQLIKVPDSDFVLGKDRAIRSIQFEAGRGYFKGLKDALRGSKSRKNWITGAGDSCDDCQANEDQGPVRVEDSFESGDDYPPGHLSCGCYIMIG